MFPFMIKKNRDGVEELQIFIDGRPYAISGTSPHYVHIKQGIKENDETKVRSFATISQTIADWTQGKVSIFGEDVYYNGEKIHGSLAKRFVISHKDGMPMLPVLNFLEKCKQNPVPTAVNELYEFLEVCTLPLDDDGDFYAYKVVRANYMDKHTGTMDNSVGKIVKMDRDKCDTNRHETCSRGLHFCSKGYLGTFFGGSDHLMMVKVNPMNVTAIPSDHKNEKGRACEYLIHSELKDADEMPHLYKPNANTLPNIDDIDLSDQFDEGLGEDTDTEDDFAELDDRGNPKPAVKAAQPKKSTVVSKISDAKRRQILAAINKSGAVLTEVANRFNVSRRTVGRIRDEG